jgi:hypothetical protein
VTFLRQRWKLNSEGCVLVPRSAAVRNYYHLTANRLNAGSVAVSLIHVCTYWCMSAMPMYFGVSVNMFCH